MIPHFRSSLDLLVCAFHKIQKYRAYILGGRVGHGRKECVLRNQLLTIWVPFVAVFLISKETEEDEGLTSRNGEEWASLKCRCFEIASILRIVFTALPKGESEEFADIAGKIAFFDGSLTGQRIGEQELVRNDINRQIYFYQHESVQGVPPIQISRETRQTPRNSGNLTFPKSHTQTTSSEMGIWSISPNKFNAVGRKIRGNGAPAP